MKVRTLSPYWNGLHWIIPALCWEGKRTWTSHIWSTVKLLSQPEGIYANILIFVRATFLVNPFACLNGTIHIQTRKKRHIYQQVLQQNGLSGIWSLAAWGMSELQTRKSSNGRLKEDKLVSTYYTWFRKQHTSYCYSKYSCWHGERKQELNDTSNREKLGEKPRYFLQWHHSYEVFAK